MSIVEQNHLSWRLNSKVVPLRKAEGDVLYCSKFLIKSVYGMYTGYASLNYMYICMVYIV